MATERERAYPTTVFALENGELIAFWTARVGETCNSELWMSRRTQQTWSQPELITNEAGDVSVASNRHGKVVTGWIRNRSEGHLCYPSGAVYKQVGEKTDVELDTTEHGSVAKLSLKVFDSGAVLAAWTRAPNGWDPSIVVRRIE